MQDITYATPANGSFDPNGGVSTPRLRTTALKSGVKGISTWVV